MTASESRAPLPHVPEADGLRGVAAMMIVFYHCWVLGGYALLDGGPLRAITGAGYFAVDLFFVISGFVLFLPCAVRGTFGSVRAYALRRAARILPAYYLSLALVIVFNSYVRTHHAAALPGQSWAGLWALVAHVLFLQQEAYGISDQTGFAVNTVVWTLSAEMAFYVLLPFIAMRVRRRPLEWLTGMVVFSLMWKLFATHSAAWLPLIGVGPLDAHQTYLLEYQLAGQMPSYLGHFAAGMGIALVYPRLALLARRETLVAFAAVAAQVGSVAALLYMFYLAGTRGLLGTDGPYDHHVNNLGVLLGFSVLLIATLVAPSPARWLFNNALARHVGDASYGIYLYHVPMIGFLLTTVGLKATGNGNHLFRLLVVLVVPGSVLGGVLSWRLMEDPIRRWARGAARSAAGGSGHEAAIAAARVEA